MSFLKQKIGDIFMSHPVYAQNPFVLRVLVPVLFLFFLIITITSLCVYAYKLLYYECTVLWKQWLCFRPRQQVKIALHCRNIFADSLLTEPLDSFPVRLFHVCRYITEIFMNDSSTFVVITINTF